MQGERKNVPVVAMYDIRGIQKYIFRTEKVKDAIGASAIVENIIEEALNYAVQKKIKEDSITAELEWQDDKGYLPFSLSEKDIQVLFIGGGNAVVLYRDRLLCVEINQIMAFYILEKTYSLQLAVAIVEKTEHYSYDYKKLHQEMNRIKADMPVSGVLGTLPVMQMEIKTGYPMVSEEFGSTESLLKKKVGENKQKNIEDKNLKIFDHLTSQKGVDSTLAVVHIDGNNMGLRIREYIAEEEDYEKAVEKMRRISYQISHSYCDVFEQMSRLFNQKIANLKEYEKKELPFCFIRKILTAGDDITYVCNAKIAMASVEYFSRQIAKRTMTGDAESKSIEKYGFSVCAGIAYIGSHFPFYTGYQVAEACCESAKDFAKCHKDGERIGNFVDYQICKNAESLNLDKVRMNEYCTWSREVLLGRPYYISAESDKKASGYQVEEIHQLDFLKTSILYFQNPEKIPRSFAKTLRNIYPLGENEMKLFQSFLQSRHWEMPDQSEEEYYLSSDGKKIAKWYDALELLDDYIDLDDFLKNVNEGEAL